METRQIISWNVNGLRAFQKKRGMVWLEQRKPDIFCVQETKAQVEQLNAALTEPDGYHGYFSSAVRKGYSGVALYTKEEPKHVAYGFGIERFDKEGRTIVAEYEDFTLLNIYFPNGKASEERLQYKMDFYEACLSFLDSLKAEGKNVIVCGDVNTAHQPIDLARPRENEKISGFLPQERAWIDKLVDHGYVDTFRMFHPEPEQYTWWSFRAGSRQRNVGWRIDYFFVDDEFKDRVTSAFILPDVMGSDHCPLGIEVGA